jgi:hypothetical protein
MDHIVQGRQQLPRDCSTPASGQSNARIYASAFRSESRASLTLEIAMISSVMLTQLSVLRSRAKDKNPG